MKKILLCCACLIVFVACDIPRDSQSTHSQTPKATKTHSQDSQLQDSFKSLESSNDTGISPKLRKSYAEYHTMLDSVKNDDWNAIVRTDTINAISAYLINLNMYILQQDSLCQSFDEYYRDSKNIEALRILDNSILDEASAKKSLSQKEANLTLIAQDKALSTTLVALAKSFNELVLEKYQKQCRR